MEKITLILSTLFPIGCVVAFVYFFTWYMLILPRKKELQWLRSFIKRHPDVTFENAREIFSSRKKYAEMYNLPHPADDLEPMTVDEVVLNAKKEQ